MINVVFRKNRNSHRERVRVSVGGDCSFIPLIGIAWSSAGCRYAKSHIFARTISLIFNRGQLQRRIHCKHVRRGFCLAFEAIGQDGFIGASVSFIRRGQPKRGRGRGSIGSGGDAHKCPGQSGSGRRGFLPLIIQRGASSGPGGTAFYPKFSRLMIAGYNPGSPFESWFWPHHKLGFSRRYKGAIAPAYRRPIPKGSSLGYGGGRGAIGGASPVPALRRGHNGHNRGSRPVFRSRTHPLEGIHGLVCAYYSYLESNRRTLANLLVCRLSRDYYSIMRPRGTDFGAYCRTAVWIRDFHPKGFALEVF